MYKSDKIDPRIYAELMSQIKRLNTDWISIRKSRQYKWGLVLTEFIDNIHSLKFSQLSKSIKRWIKGYKSGKIKSVFSYKDDNEKGNQSYYFSSERIVIYTAVFGSYDQIVEPYCIPDNCDFFIFTDQDISEKSIWKKAQCPNLNGMSSAEKNRYIKMNPHYLFKDYKYSIYLDGNVQPITDLTEYINKLTPIGLGIHRHKIRSCIYDELKAVVKTKRMSVLEATKYKQHAIDLGMPRNYGLLQCSVIVREHHNPICIDIMENWWKEYMEYGKRDQLYLPLVLFTHHISIEQVAVLGNDLYNNPSFRVLNHKS